MKALGNGEFCKKNQGGVKVCDWRLRWAGGQAVWGGRRAGTRPYLQIQLHGLLGCHRQFGEGRVDFPQEPKGDDIWGEGEAVRAGQSRLPVQEPAESSALPAWSIWERSGEPRPCPVTSSAPEEEKPLVLPAGLRPLRVQSFP